MNNWNLNVYLSNLHKHSSKKKQNHISLYLHHKWMKWSWELNGYYIRPFQLESEALLIDKRLYSNRFTRPQVNLTEKPCVFHISSVNSVKKMGTLLLLFHEYLWQYHCESACKRLTFYDRIPRENRREIAIDGVIDD